MKTLTLCSLLACCVGPILCEWWVNSVIYQIYPQSFYDSNNDGIGDLKGITKKIPYLKGLGVDAIWLNPIYKSPMKDSGYDISNFKEVNRMFGTLYDLRMLTETLRCNGMRLILDFVPNHTSDQHEWFKKSVKMIEPYTDYYVWRDPSGFRDDKPLPPNNWASIFSLEKPGSAWTYSTERKQFYYHAFMVEQPDLNLRNPEVVNELKRILKYWKDEGVSGFRFDAAPQYMEDERFTDNPAGSQIHTQNVKDTFDFVRELRSYIDSLSKTSGDQILLMTEAYCDQENTMKFYGDPNNPGAHFSFNFLFLTDFNKQTDAYGLQKIVNGYLSQMKNNRIPNWVSGNHDWPRIPSRMGGRAMADMLNMLTLLLPGTAITFMGDEIGADSYWQMDKRELPPTIADDFRLPSRTPFAWTAGKNAGFTKRDDAWVPVNPDYYDCNVLMQTFRRLSTLNNYKKMVQIKKSSIGSEGTVKVYVVSEKVFGILRKFDNYLYYAICNLGSSFEGPINVFRTTPELRKAKHIEVAVKSENMICPYDDMEKCDYDFIDDQISLPPKGYVVLSARDDS